jgi:hypothetical protein
LVRTSVGDFAGVSVGVLVGTTVGNFVGDFVGVVVRTTDGVFVGVFVVNNRRCNVLHNKKSPGASGIRIEHLKAWYNGSETDESCYHLWRKVVELVQRTFAGDNIPKAFCRGILVLLPKGNGEFSAIALLETIYKLILSIINQRLGVINLHDSIHGFRKWRGTGTATVEAKLAMQPVKQSGNPYYIVFLDSTKAYDTLDPKRTLEVLKGYGVGDNVRRIISHDW